MYSHKHDRRLQHVTNGCRDWIETVVKFFLAAALLFPLIANAFCNSSDGSCAEWVPISDSHSLQVHRTFPLDDVQPDVTRAVVVVHGTDSNAGEYFDRMIQAAGIEGVIDETLIVAPLFRSVSTGAASNELYWLDSSSSGHSWKQGDPSANPEAGISSFTALDSLLQRVTNRTVFPNLRVITITGHSAGGQFVQRYAVGTQFPSLHTDHNFAYVVANPSSFMYLDRRRPESGSTSEFSEPSTSCPFNRYKYGTDSMNAYMSTVGAETIIENYRNRFVVYLTGELDNNPADVDLDISCQAMLQGPDRLTRATTYASYIDMLYANHSHQFSPVPGVGHSSSQMFKSAEGRAAIFADEAEMSSPPLAPPSPPKDVRMQ